MRAGVSQGRWFWQVERMIRSFGLAPDAAEIEALARGALERLPEPFRAHLDGVLLRVEDFAEQLIEQVRKIGLPLRFITLEITEKHTLSLDMTVIENITTLVRRGVNLSLDDFGTGFSSIARLAQLPFNQIKLDAGFVAQSLGFKESRIIESIVALSGALNLEVVAEGVETEKQRKHLELLGVDAAQGYLFYKALDGAALVSALLATTTSALLDKTRGV